MGQSFATAFQVCGYLIAIPLEMLVIRAVLRGEYRRYPFLLVYLIVDLLTSILEILFGILPLERDRGMRVLFIRIYWIDEWIIQFVLFLLVVSLVHRSSEHLRSRRTLVAMLVGFSVLFAGGSFLLHYRPNLILGKWMTPWARDMNFGAAILDLGLWALLLSRPNRDWCLLMISGALGIQFTGSAIGQALRELSHDTLIPASVLIVSANIVCLYIWRQVFRQPVPLKHPRL